MSSQFDTFLLNTKKPLDVKQNLLKQPIKQGSS